MSTRAATGDLGGFLRSRRARLTPDQAGLPSYGARRVPGLRREELAQLAGVSATYYTRLEQGHSTNASDSVIDAIAGALCLDEDERSHLRALARPVRARGSRPSRPDTAPASTVRMINAMADQPAVLLGRRTEVLAWNPLGHLLLAGHLDFTAPNRPADRPNLTRLLFLDAHTRELYTRWDEEAVRAVASLRMVAGRYRDDRELTDLVGELTMKSDEFARLWAKHPVRSCTAGFKYFHHPVVGDLKLEFGVLQIPDESWRRVIWYAPLPDTPSSAAVRLLGPV